MTRSLAAELRQLTAEVIRMGGLAEAQVVDAVDAERCSAPTSRSSSNRGMFSLFVATKT